ncbi:MAG: hypothetical protein E6J90_39615 [Deltaproteobacteria bacterium]|nr:MAG: hypothetical protein E6J90_39615 [Deltaproteobacteria bacterium]TMQ21975.1 MAG: hypothetical protein E6J91_01900 [Deltaproteobacteria bacterium]
MKPEVVLELLEAAAEQLHVRVSYEPLQTTVVHGGLCRVKGEHRIIVDKRASAEERVTTLATALAQVLRLRSKAGGGDAPDTTVELSPKVLEVLRMHDPVGRVSPGARATGSTKGEAA